MACKNELAAILESKIEVLERENEYLKTMNDGLLQHKNELISIIKATAELIEKFELWNELSFEILFSHIENILKKHKGE